MAYVPPSCIAIGFDFAGIYTPPSCVMINFDMGGTAPHEILSDDIEILIESPVMELFCGDLIQSNNVQIDLEFEDSYIDPLVPISSAYASIFIESDQHDVEILPDIINENVAISLDFDEGLIRGTEAHHLPSKIDIGNRSYPWGNGVISDDRLCMSFGEGEDIHHHVHFPVQENISPDYQIKCRWQTQYHKDRWNCSSYADLSILIDWHYCSPYIGWIDYKDSHFTIDWGEEHTKIDWQFCISYSEPGSHDIKKCVSWNEPVFYDQEFCASWNAPGSYDVHKYTPWGPFSYYLLCYGNTNYYPPRSCASINFEFPNKYELTPNLCSDIIFYLDGYATDPDPRCPWKHVHSGIRDRYMGIQIPDIHFPPAKEVYYMLNSVLVKEILTNLPIEVLQVSMTIDRDSWLWQFNVTVASLDCLEIIKPINGVYAHIQIDINGYSWMCTVEGWKETRTFGKETWTIIGRSPSIMFASPIASKKSYTEPTAQQGQTIFNGIVSDGVNIPANWPTQLQAWTGDWASYNNTCTGFGPWDQWWIPSNTLSYTDKTPIEVLKNMTDSIGAYIQTDPSNNVMHVKPIYAWQPWDWDVTNTNIDWKPIVENQCKEIARSTKLNPYYQAIHVMGENIGGNDAGTGNDVSNTAIFVDIVKDGYSRAVAAYAPMATHSLVTSAKSGLEYGRMVLGETGEWIEHTLRLGVLCPDSESSGLFVPGDMVTVLERGLPWYGQVTSTTISAMMTNNAFAVSQQIGIEEFINSV